MDRETGHELHVDGIYDIVEAYEQQLATRGLCNDLQPEHQEHLVHLFLSGLESDGFTEEAARDVRDDLDEIVRPHGWFVAKCSTILDPGPQHAEDPQRLCYIDVFPQRGAVQTVPDTVLHVAPRNLRDAIQTQGLRPGCGGSDHITTPHPRLYVALHPLVADAIVGDMERLRGWTEVDTWRIDLTNMQDRAWYRDVELPDLGAWSDGAIGPEHLTLIGR